MLKKKRDRIRGRLVCLHCTLLITLLIFFTYIHPTPRAFGERPTSAPLAPGIRNVQPGTQGTRSYTRTHTSYRTRIYYCCCCCACYRTRTDLYCSINTRAVLAAHTRATRNMEEQKPAIFIFPAILSFYVQQQQQECSFSVWCPRNFLHTNLCARRVGTRLLHVALRQYLPAVFSHARHTMGKPDNNIPSPPPPPSSAAYPQASSSIIIVSTAVVEYLHSQWVPDSQPPSPPFFLLASLS